MNWIDFIALWTGYCVFLFGAIRAILCGAADTKRAVAQFIAVLHRLPMEALISAYVYQDKKKSMDPDHKP